MSEEFTLMYKILKIIKSYNKCEEIDIDQLNYTSLNTSYPMYCHVMQLLVENGFIDGVSIRIPLGDTLPNVQINKPRITLKGLEYLEENSIMKKIAQVGKGIINIIK